MKKMNLITVMLMIVALTSCAALKKEKPLEGNARTSKSTQVQFTDPNAEAHARATALTTGWPESSITAAKEMVVKYGEPAEVTNNSLIWTGVAPFKRVIVHREVFSSKFPLLHQNPVEHVADYKAPINKIKDVLNYNEAIVIDRTRGEISVGGENEAMNFLSLNLAHEIMHGKISPNAARIQHGKEALNYLNGNRTAMTQTLTFGNQINTSSTGESITNKIRWEGDKSKVNTRQAQEEK